VNSKHVDDVVRKSEALANTPCIKQGIQGLAKWAEKFIAIRILLHFTGTGQSLGQRGISKRRGEKPLRGWGKAGRRDERIKDETLRGKRKSQKKEKKKHSNSSTQRHVPLRHQEQHLQTARCSAIERERGEGVYKKSLLFIIKSY